MYAIGYDLGSSSIKAALVRLEDGATLARIQEPETEMPMAAPRAGWAEQNPEDWWVHLCRATQRVIAESGIDKDAVQSVGISYQMHGLVLLGADGEVLRPSIIWCDSRAVELGEKAFAGIGAEHCLEHCLNSPGNFTAAKLKWVKENEPDIYARAHYAMLPGDYVAYRLSGEANTTPGGLSEGVLWDFKTNEPAQLVLDEMGLNADLLPPLVPSVGEQARVSAAGAAATGLPAGILIGYRAGDQPNNALALNVLEPGEVAATAGTSGVVYAVTDQLRYDARQRVNGFLHVNHTAAAPRVGVLLCINGAGILHRWLRQNLGGDELTYEAMETLAAGVPIGSDGLSFLPFGNGAERMLKNHRFGANLMRLDLNRHTKPHVIRAGIEGVAFAFVYGMGILQYELGIDLSTIRVGNDNLFQSQIFATTVATLTGANIEVRDTTGAVGAALAGAAGAGLVADLRTACGRTPTVAYITPDKDRMLQYQLAYSKWAGSLEVLSY